MTSPAPVAASAPVAVAQGVALPPNMPLERLEAFRTTVADRLRLVAASNPAFMTDVVARTKAVEAETARIADEQRVIATAIHSDAFRAAMADAYAQELAQQQTVSSLPEARRETDSIINNRVADCQNFIHLLRQPDFIASVYAEMAQRPKPKGEYKLSAKKIEEEVNNILYKADGTAQPAVHVAMSARGHRVGHKALAEMFKPKTGILRAPMIAAITHSAPNYSGAQIEALATDWLKARHDPAHSITDALMENGEIYTRAMALAEQKQGEALARQLPATVTTAPRIVQGTVVAPTPQKDLVTL